uniref:Uncharacterized protein n=1 Tax=Coturnix japonica TaxID=93934 RepID=A0A8C2UIH5_COTJA
MSIHHLCILFATSFHLICFHLFPERELSQLHTYILLDSIILLLSEFFLIYTVGHDRHPPHLHLKETTPATHKFQHVPVKHIVIGEALSVGIVRFVIKTKRTAEVQVCGKFSCNKRNGLIRFHYLVGKNRRLSNNVSKTLKIQQTDENHYICVKLTQY